MDLPALIESSVALATHDPELKKYGVDAIRIIRNIDPNLKRVICSPSEIEQVIFNLLKNATQAVGANRPGPAGPVLPCIKIRLTQGDRSVKIEIEDNGPGMEKQVRDRIFEPFFTTKSIGAGTGLGLSVAYYIVTQNHNGTFAVKSEPGQGAAFIITLPCEA